METKEGENGHKIEFFFEVLKKNGVLSEIN